MSQIIAYFLSKLLSPMPNHLCSHEIKPFFYADSLCSQNHIFFCVKRTFKLFFKKKHLRFFKDEHDCTYDNQFSLSEPPQ